MALMSGYCWLLAILGHILLIDVKADVFQQDHDVENCIKDTDILLCVSLQSISFNGAFNGLFYVHMTDANYVHYQSGTLSVAASNLHTAASCFLYAESNTVDIQIIDASTNEPIGDTNINMNETVLNISSMALTQTGILDAVFTIWTAAAQCFEVVSGDMFIADTFAVNIDLYRLNGVGANASNQSSVISWTTRSVGVAATSTANWNNMICLQGSPSLNMQYLGANIHIESVWSGHVYDLLYINHGALQFGNTFESSSYSSYTGADAMTAYFAIGSVTMKYWQSCNIACNDKFGPCWHSKQHHLLQEQFPLYVMYLILLILLIYLLMMALAFVNHKYFYKCSDSVHWTGLSWLLIELCDWWTDVLFVLFLYFNLHLITDERIPGLSVLFICSICSLLLTYLINVIYLIHYLQMWTARSSPGVTRLWLQEWSWFLIFLSMSAGGVHVALEFCNSLITPNLNIFTMHIPRSEMVRTRKDRFVTNVFFENLPFLFIYISFLVAFKRSSFDDDATNFTVYLCMLTTVLSLILSTMWAFYRRGYSQQHPLALYSVSIHFKTSFWKQYYVHAHAKICSAIQDGLEVRKMNLIILDQCSESYHSMKIEARILKDTKESGYKIPASQQAAAGKILNMLIEKFQDDEHKGKGGTMELKGFSIQHVNYGEGEYVYDHNTGIFVLCNGIKDCFCPNSKMVAVKKSSRANSRNAAFKPSEIFVDNAGNSNNNLHQSNQSLHSVNTQSRTSPFGFNPNVKRGTETLHEYSRSNNQSKPGPMHMLPMTSLQQASTTEHSQSNALPSPVYQTSANPRVSETLSFDPRSSANRNALQYAAHGHAQHRRQNTPSQSSQLQIKRKRVPTRELPPPLTPVMSETTSLREELQ